MSKRQGLPVDLTEEQIDEFGREMDAIYYETLESRGEKDRLYILRLIRIQRSMALFGRLTIYASLFLLPAWPHALAGWGTRPSSCGAGPHWRQMRGDRRQPRAVEVRGRPGQRVREERQHDVRPERPVEVHGQRLHRHGDGGDVAIAFVEEVAH